jgi:hypothetical protein
MKINVIPDYGRPKLAIEVVDGRPNISISTLPRAIVKISIRAGLDGDSAYELAIQDGFEGTLSEWLASLIGDDGNDGTNGASAYELAVQDGFVGTQPEWLASLQGPAGDDGTNGTNGTNGAAADMTRSSTTNYAIASTGSKTFAYTSTSANIGWGIGMRIRAAVTANPSTFMEGVITSVSTTQVIFTADNSAGSGSYSVWTLSVTGSVGPAGAAGTPAPVTKKNSSSYTTNSTTNVVAQTIAVEVGYLATSDLPLLRVQGSKTGSNNAARVEVYINTTADLSGSPVLLATYDPLTTIRNFTLERQLRIISATSIGVQIPAATSANTDVGATTANPATITVPNIITGSVYIVIAVKVNNSLDTVSISNSQFKPCL